MGSYKDLEIYKLASELEHKVFLFSIKLPDYEKYELGSQVRRSSSGIRSNIADGYGRCRYKQEFIRYLIFSKASSDETFSHLEILDKRYPELHIKPQILDEYDLLSRKIASFIEYVRTHWKTAR